MKGKREGLVEGVVRIQEVCVIVFTLLKAVQGTSGKYCVRDFGKRTCVSMHGLPHPLMIQYGV